MERAGATAPRSGERAFTLTEVLIASVILALVGIPVMGVFITAKQGITRTDVRREARYYIQEILAHLDRQSLHDLWRNFGPGEVLGHDVAGRLRHRLAEFDPATGRIAGKNPLGFEEEFLQEMIQEGLDARVFFEFYTRKELEIDPPKYTLGVQDKPSPKYGIYHMQAGWAEVVLLDTRKLRAARGKESQAVLASWKQPIMCPAIVGRPGLKLSGCPAVNVRVKLEYAPLLERRERSM
jgi:prepilin-type N-terminal cleavage/methylation domain-containing protein